MADAPLVQFRPLSRLFGQRPSMLSTRHYSLAGNVQRQYRLLGVFQPRLATVQRQVTATPAHTGRSVADWQPVRIIWGGQPSLGIPGEAPATTAPLASWATRTAIQPQPTTPPPSVDATEPLPPRAGESPRLRVSARRPTSAQPVSRQAEPEEESNWLGSGLVRGTDLWQRLFPDRPGYEEASKAEQAPPKKEETRRTPPPEIPSRLPRTRTWEISTRQPPAVARKPADTSAASRPTESAEKSTPEEETEAGAPPARAGPFPRTESESPDTLDEEGAYPSDLSSAAGIPAETGIEAEMTSPGEEAADAAIPSEPAIQPRQALPVSRKAFVSEESEASAPEEPEPPDLPAESARLEEEADVEPSAAELGVEPRPVSTEPPTGPRAPAPAPGEQSRAVEPTAPQRIQTQQPPSVSRQVETPQTKKSARSQPHVPSPPLPLTEVGEKPAAETPVAKREAVPRRVRADQPPMVSRQPPAPEASEPALGPATLPEGQVAPIPDDTEPVVKPPDRIAAEPLRVQADRAPTPSQQPEAPEVDESPELDAPLVGPPLDAAPPEAEPTAVAPSEDEDIDIDPGRSREEVMPQESRLPEAPSAEVPGPAETPPLKPPVARPRIVAQRATERPIPASDVEPRRVQAVPEPAIGRLTEAPWSEQPEPAEARPQDSPVTAAPSGEEPASEPPTIASSVQPARVPVSLPAEAPEVEETGPAEQTRVEASPAPAATEKQPGVESPEAGVGTASRPVRTEPTPMVSRKPDPSETEAIARTEQTLIDTPFTPTPIESETAAESPTVGLESEKHRVGVEPTPPVSRKPEAPAGPTPIEAPVKPARVGEEITTKPSRIEPGAETRRVRPLPGLTSTVSRQIDAREAKELPPPEQPMAGSRAVEEQDAGSPALIPEGVPRRVRAAPPSQAVMRREEASGAGELAESAETMPPTLVPGALSRPAQLPLHTALRPASSRPIVDRERDLARSEPESQTLPRLFQLPPAKPAPLPLRLPVTPTVQRQEATPPAVQTTLVGSAEREATDPGRPDVAALAREVYDVIKRRIGVEREQLGGF